MEPVWISSVLDVNLRKFVDLRKFPWLRAIAQISIRKVEHRGHEHRRNSERFERHCKTIGRCRCCDDGYRALSVAPKHRLEEIGLLRLGWQAGTWTAPLDVRDHHRQFGHYRQADGLRFQCDARSTGTGQPKMSGKRRSN